ncbi:hypothetical protein CUMW_171380 [Citrus unshiu]|nr:hypothetical protein CUMW_171380 [Citrus unshiu]
MLSVSNGPGVNTKSREHNAFCQIKKDKKSSTILSLLLESTYRMHISELSTESDEVFRFDKSLRELKDLRSQLHYAADYCESTFLNAKEKTTAVENTKEYICNALITVVDHLGNVSANLDNCIPNSNAYSEAELRINSLKQRLLSCELYAHKLALNRVKWNVVLPRYHRRYLSAHKQEFDIQDVPLFMYTFADKSSAIKNLPSKNSVDKFKNSVVECDPNLASARVLLPVRDGISILAKGPNPIFHFQLGNRNPGRRSLRRSFQSTEIMSLIRRTKKNKMKV